MNNLTRTALIAKTSFLAETLYRYGVRFFRDQESRPAGYPGGYLYEGARLFRGPHASPGRQLPYRNQSSARKTLLFQFL